MFAPAHTLQAERNPDQDSGEPEDYEAPVNWALDDFEDILQLHREFAEVVQ